MPIRRVEVGLLSLGLSDEWMGSRMRRRLRLWTDWLDDAGFGGSFCIFCFYRRRTGGRRIPAKIDEAFDRTIPSSFEPGLMAMEQLQSVGVIGEAPIGQGAADRFIGLLIGFGELLGLVVHFDIVERVFDDPEALQRHFAKAISSTMECS